jgi:phosphate transport system permease protein
MLTQAPTAGYYLGEGGGILNAILGSLYLAGGGTLLALLLSLPIALYLEVYARSSLWASLVRLALDVLWGIPSIVYGAFGFTLMLALGLRASLLGGILTLALVELPIMTRAMDEIIRLMPFELKESNCSGW